MFLLFAFLSSCLAARFAMFPMPFGRSHLLFVSKLGLELSARGHEVQQSRLIVYYAKSFSATIRNPRVTATEILENFGAFKDKDRIERGTNTRGCYNFCSVIGCTSFPRPDLSIP